MKGELMGHEAMVDRERLLIRRSLLGLLLLSGLFTLVSIFGVRPSLERTLEESVIDPMDRVLEEAGVPVRLNGNAKSLDQLELSFRGGGRRGTLRGNVRSPAVREQLNRTMAENIGEMAADGSPLAGVKEIELAVGLSPPDLESFLAVDAGSAPFPAAFDPVEFARDSPHSNPLEFLSGQHEHAEASSVAIRVCGIVPTEKTRREILDSIQRARPEAGMIERLVVSYEAKPEEWTEVAAERLEDDLREFTNFQVFVSRKSVMIGGESRDEESQKNSRETWTALATAGGNLVRTVTAFHHLSPLEKPLVRFQFTGGAWSIGGRTSPDDSEAIENCAASLESLGLKVKREVSTDPGTGRCGVGKNAESWLRALSEDTHTATLSLDGESPTITAQARDGTSRKRLQSSLEKHFGGNGTPKLEITLPPETSVEFALPGSRVRCTGVVPDDETKLRFERLIAGYPSSESNIRIDPHALPSNWPDEIDKAFRLFLRHAWNGKVNLTGRKIALEGQVLYDGEKRELAMAFDELRDDHGFAVAGAFETGEPEVDGDLRNLLRAATNYFEAGSTSLTPEQAAAIGRAADELVNYPELRIVIAGHADSSGDSEENLELSRARAEAVGKVLQRAGIEPGRIALKVFGDTRASADESTDEGRRLNRRVEIKVK